MRPAIIYVKENGKLDITQERLDELLRDAYNQGYDDGKRQYDWWKYPNWSSPYRYTVTCANDINTTYTTASSCGTQDSGECTSGYVETLSTTGKCSCGGGCKK